MKRTLYLSNLAPTVDEGLLFDLCGQYGEVEAVEFCSHQLYGEPYALVKMAVEKNATKAYHGLNGHIIDGHYLTISYPEVDLTRKLLPKQQKFTDNVIAELGETEAVPIREITTMALLCGVGFVRTILEEAKEVYAQDGIMTSDGLNKRTLGGIFFYLARRRMPEAMRKIVYNRKGKLPSTDQETDVDGEDENTEEV